MKDDTDYRGDLITAQEQKWSLNQRIKELEQEIERLDEENKSLSSIRLRLIDRLLDSDIEVERLKEVLRDARPFLLERPLGQHERKVLNAIDKALTPSQPKDVNTTEL